jgi:hypothetical protein
MLWIFQNIRWVLCFRLMIECVVYFISIGFHNIHHLMDNMKGTLPIIDLLHGPYNLLSWKHTPSDPIPQKTTLWSYGMHPIAHYNSRNPNIGDLCTNPKAGPISGITMKKEYATIIVNQRINPNGEDMSICNCITIIISIISRI